MGRSFRLKNIYTSQNKSANRIFFLCCSKDSRIFHSFIFEKSEALILIIWMAYNVYVDGLFRRTFRDVGGGGGRGSYRTDLKDGGWKNVTGPFNKSCPSRQWSHGFCWSLQLLMKNFSDQFVLEMQMVCPIHLTFDRKQSGDLF